MRLLGRYNESSGRRGYRVAVVVLFLRRRATSSRLSAPSTGAVFVVAVPLGDEPSKGRADVGTTDLSVDGRGSLSVRGERGDVASSIMRAKSEDRRPRPISDVGLPLGRRAATDVRRGGRGAVFGDGRADVAPLTIDRSIATLLRLWPLGRRGDFGRRRILAEATVPGPVVQKALGGLTVADSCHAKTRIDAAGDLYPCCDFFARNARQAVASLAAAVHKDCVQSGDNNFEHSFSFVAESVNGRRDLHVDASLELQNTEGRAGRADGERGHGHGHTHTHTHTQRGGGAPGQERQKRRRRRRPRLGRPRLRPRPPRRRLRLTTPS